VALLRSLGQRWPPLLVLLVAAVAVTLLDPWALLQPGFWLSFAAVGLLMASDLGAAPAPDAGAGRVARLRAALRAALRSQAVATAGLAPLSMVFFQQVSLVGFAANLVAIPLVTLVVTPLALAGAGLTLLWQPAAWLVGGLTDLLGWLVRWPWAVWTAPAAPAWAVAVGLAGTALLLTPLPWRLRWLGLPMLLPLLVPPVQRPAEGRFELVVADVGQGTAVLLRTRTHLLVYDAGPRYSPQADAGQRVLLPLLRARGETQVDLLMLSHRDADHVGGAAALIDSGRVRALATSFDPAHLLRGAALPHRRCEAGQSWSWDGVRFDVLHPLAGAYHAAAKPNTLSCVLRVAADDARSVLLTGDIEAAQEAALLARDAPALRSQVLVVPHHGSRGSSSDPFIAAVAPGTALVQAAYLSRFGHPAPQVVARYRALGVELLRTDACGAWTWSADGATRCERLAAARYWHHRPADDAPR
jgi:competence protein ComEC